MLPLTSPQITEWQAYYRLEPFGALRMDKQLGRLAWMYACAHSKKGVKPKLKDYIMFPEPLPPSAKQSMTSQLAVAGTISAALAHKRKDG